MVAATFIVHKYKKPQSGKRNPQRACPCVAEVTHRTLTLNPFSLFDITRFSGARGGGGARGGAGVAPSPSLMPHGCLGGAPRPGVTGGFLYKMGVVSYTIRILMYLACILHVSCMYFDVSRS